MPEQFDPGSGGVYAVRYAGFLKSHKPRMMLLPKCTPLNSHPNVATCDSLSTNLHQASSDEEPLNDYRFCCLYVEHIETFQSFQHPICLHRINPLNLLPSSPCTRPT